MQITAREVYLKERKEFRQLFGIERSDSDGQDVDVEKEEKAILKILEEISDVNAQEVVDYVCCEDIRQRDVEPDIDHVLAMGGNVIAVPVHTAKVVQQLLSANRRLVLTIAGGVGRLTPAFLERVEAEYGRFPRDAETGNVCLPEASKMLKTARSKPAPTLQTALDFSRLGAKREDVEAYLSEADLYLEVILRTLSDTIQKLRVEVLVRDRHTVAPLAEDFTGLLVLMDSCSTNSGQNVEHAKELLEGSGLAAARLKTALLQVPLLQRRALATAKHHLQCPLRSINPQGPSLAALGAPARLEACTLAWGELRRIKAYAARKPPFFHLPDGFREDLWEGVERTAGVVDRAVALLTAPAPA